MLHTVLGELTAHPRPPRWDWVEGRERKTSALAFCSPKLRQWTTVPEQWRYESFNDWIINYYVTVMNDDWWSMTYDLEQYTCIRLRFWHIGHCQNCSENTPLQLRLHVLLLTAIYRRLRFTPSWLMAPTKEISLIDWLTDCKAIMGARRHRQGGEDSKYVAISILPRMRSECNVWNAVGML